MRDAVAPASMQDDFCKISVATFDRLAERYAEKYFHLETYNQYLDRFARQIASQGSVLDVACGPGNVAAYLTRIRPDLEIVGIDLAEGMIQQARARVPSARFLVSDCRQMGELNSKFDAAAFAFGLSYLTDADAVQFFNSLGETLNDSASLYLSTMTGTSDSSGFEASSGDDRVYIEYRPVDEVVSMVERAGYRVEFTDQIASPDNAPKPTQDLIVIASRSTV